MTVISRGAGSTSVASATMPPITAPAMMAMTARKRNRVGTAASWQVGAYPLRGCRWQGATLNPLTRAAIACYEAEP